MSELGCSRPGGDGSPSAQPPAPPREQSNPNASGAGNFRGRVGKAGGFTGARLGVPSAGLWREEALRLAVIVSART